jgi:hypothetical protein
VITVLRSGGEYGAKHVARLRDQIPAHTGMVCLTDEDVDLPGVEDVGFRYEWPGWWAKMELFRPGWFEDFVYMDLDTTVVGDIGDILSVSGEPVVLQDFYRARGLQSSLMYIPEQYRTSVWNEWITKPEYWIANTRHGDQGFIERHWLRIARRWQDLLPGQAVSYKVHVRPENKVPDGARVVCFHGRPRPWDIPELASP